MSRIGEGAEILEQGLVAKSRIIGCVVKCKAEIFGIDGKAVGVVLWDQRKTWRGVFFEGSALWEGVVGCVGKAIASPSALLLEFEGKRGIAGLDRDIGLK